MEKLVSGHITPKTFNLKDISTQNNYSVWPNCIPYEAKAVIINEIKNK